MTFKRPACNPCVQSIGDIRHQNLLLLIGRAGSAADLANRCGSSPQYISQLVNRTADQKTGKPRELGSAMARRLEGAMGVPVGWMDTQHPIAGEPSANYQMAHPVSQPLASYSLPVISWEQLVNEQALDGASPQFFVLELATDATAPQWPAGLSVVWATGRPARPGRPVLIRDTHGRHHVRLYREGKHPGQWLASATDPSFASFTDEDGASVVAVYCGQLELG